MKRFLLTFLAGLITATGTLWATDYEITALTTPTISIGGKTLKKGDRFSDRGAISWADNRQSMEVKNLSTGRLHRLSAKAMKTKWDARSMADFIASTSKGSTRGESGKVLFEKAANSDKFAEKRIALVIGNSDYETQAYLRNAQKDANDVAATLQQLGFDIIEAYECSYGEMKQALGLFQEKAQGYDVAVFYFAGHGLQDEGVNYLLPVEAKLEMRSELKECLNADDVLYTLEHSGVPERIAFMDACRNIKRSWNRSTEQGLARMEGEPGSVIMFSTSSGNVAFDGEGDNSPFAKALISNIVKAGAGFAETMASIARDTYAGTDRRQTPLQVGTLMSDFAFNKPGVAIAAAAISAAADAAVQTVTRRNDSQSSYAPSRPSRPAVQQPRMEFDADIAVMLRSCKRAGNKLRLTFMLENRSRKDMQAMVATQEHGHDTGVFDNEGNEYRGGDVLFAAGGATYFEMCPQVPLPVGRPVKLEMTVNDFSRTASSLPVAYINFRNAGTSDPYGAATLEIRNIPVGFDMPEMPENNLRTSVDMTAPDIDVNVTDARRAGNAVIFSIVMTNNSRNTITPDIVGKEPCAGYTYATQFITSEGDIHDRYQVIVTKGNSTEAIDRFSLPQGVPVKLNIRLKDYPRNESTVKYFQLDMRNVDPAETYGIGALTIENLPIR